MNKETGYSLGQIAYDVCHHAIDLKENQIQALLEIGFPFDEEAWELGDLVKAVLSTSQEKVNEQDDLGTCEGELIDDELQGGCNPIQQGDDE